MVSRRISSLKSKSDFRNLALRGRRARVLWLTIDYTIEHLQLPSMNLQYGLSISKKIGSAVVRNKIKRWCREFFRKLAKDSLPAEVGIKLNIRLKENGDFYKNIRHAEFGETLQKAWDRIRRDI